MNLKRSKLSFTGQIFLALILAIIAGCLMQSAPEVANDYIKPFGVIFLNLLKFIVVPLVMLSIIAGIISMEDISKVGKLGIRALIYFTLTTIAAVSVSLVVSTCLKGYFPLIKLPAAEGDIQVHDITFMDQIVNMFPNNAVLPFSEANMMQVIVITLFFGFAIVHVGEKAKPAKEILMSFNEIVQKILGYILNMAPIGVFCMLTPVVATNGPQVVGSYASLIGADYLCFLIHALIIYTPSVYFLGGMNPIKFFQKMTPAMMFAFSSASSVATIPYNVESTKKMGVREEISNFILPLGATINMDGTAIYLGVTSVFIATCCGMDLSMHQYIAIALSSTIASIGVPGVPGGALALMAMVFASAGIPIEGVAVAAGVDRLVDMGRTTMSITGDASCAVVMQRFSKGIFKD